MPSQRTLVWVGAVALVLVAAGAGAVVWTHPEFVRRNAAETPVVASAPAEPKAPIASPAPPAVPATPPAASASASGGKAANETAAVALEPAFDVVNVDRSGEAVVAGRAAPNAKVELRDGGKAVAEATADAAGQFVIIPPALAPGDHSLSLAASAEKAAPVISSPVAVSVPAQEARVAAAAPVPAQEAKVAPAAPVPAQETKVAAVAPTNPDEPAHSALGMRTLATPSSANGSRVAIHLIEADAVGGLVAKGSAEPNAKVRLYLNQADLAEANTQSDGHWSFTIQHGMSPGGYVMRADEMSASGASVVASAEAPFVYPEAPSPAPTASALASAIPEPSSASSPADPVVGSVQTKRVATGHTLWALSQSYYGDPTRYPEIVDANRKQIPNPNLIYPGEVFVVPKLDAKR